MKTLFIGNSHTYFNDMPAIFQKICRENGIDMHVTMLTQGGMGLDYHAKQPEVRFNILFGGYDIVVLQHTAHHDLCQVLAAVFFVHRMLHEPVFYIVIDH